MGHVTKQTLKDWWEQRKSRRPRLLGYEVSFLLGEEQQKHLRR